MSVKKKTTKKNGAVKKDKAVKRDKGASKTGPAKAARAGRRTSGPEPMSQLDAGTYIGRQGASLEEKFWVWVKSDELECWITKNGSYNPPSSANTVSLLVVTWECDWSDAGDTPDEFRDWVIARTGLGTEDLDGWVHDCTPIDEWSP